MNSSEKVKFLHHRTLSISDYNAMNDEIMKNLGILEYEDINDYIIIVVELNGEEYTFIEGYSEDTLTGVFIYEDTEVMVKIEDGVASPEDHPLSKWYYELIDGEKEYLETLSHGENTF
uniref:Uncharacterized protein n=1 Tax=Pithovirus LCPAC403 TaxID=2506596 RepID=A0A481ZBG4_9VIRU|nr:MAG: hypothetical protein LCPAC403_03780 [Pithovirus LCPAC403]